MLIESNQRLSRQHPAESYTQSQNAPTLNFRHGPTALCSGGIFLLVVGTALLLPGRDINGWRGREQPQQPAAISTSYAQQLLHTPLNFAPNTEVFMIEGHRVCGFHWHQHCPVLSNIPEGGRKRPVLAMTYAAARSRAQARRLWPCQRCRDIETSIDTTMQD